MSDRKKEREKKKILTLIVLVAVIFTGLGYGLSMSTIGAEQVEDYIQDLSAEGIEELFEDLEYDVLIDDEKSDYPMEVEDDLEREIELSENPERIISLSPSITEIIFELGLENRLVGVSESCDHPQKIDEFLEENKIEIAGPFAQPLDSEKIAMLNPDLVISAAGTPMDSIEELEELGIDLIGLEAETLEDITTIIEKIGRITNKEDMSEELGHSIENELTQIEDITGEISENERPRVYYEIDELWTAGSGTFIEELIQLAGGFNVMSEVGEGYFPVGGKEELYEQNPEVFLSTPFVRSQESQIKEEYPDLRAVEENRVYILEQETVDAISRPGPRVPEAARELAKIFHPELEEEF